MNKVPFQDTHVILREYDLINDPEKLAVHLFNQMETKEANIQSIREGDKWFEDRFYFRKRLIAEIEGELHATLTMEKGLNRFTEHRFRLFSVVTSPQYRGTGLSQILLDYTKEWTKEHGSTILLVETWEDNIPARKFYEKMGFIQYASLPNGLKKRNGEGYVDEILYLLVL
ncbi:MAG: GNAT family N-acetyltransferase [Promethearchaeota archaeon]